MAKIIRINGNDVVVAKNENEIVNVELSTLSFSPNVGDEVEVYHTGDGIIINKITSSDSSSTQVIITQNGKVVNKMTYALLAIFLGGVGVHHFYAGKTMLGILHIVFCWTFIPAIIAFIQGIVALTKKEDANGNIIV